MPQAPVGCQQNLQPPPAQRLQLRYRQTRARGPAPAHTALQMVSLQG